MGDTELPPCTALNKGGVRREPFDRTREISLLDIEAATKRPHMTITLNFYNLPTSAFIQRIFITPHATTSYFCARFLAISSFATR